MTKQQRLVLVVSILASSVGALDGFIVNVALPTITRDIGGGLVEQQWIMDAYLLTLGSLMLLAGSLSDLFGRKRMLTFGLVWFGAASLLCSMAPNGPFLVVMRALQGGAGALLVPSSLAMIISTFSGPAQSKAIGTWTAWFSIAAVTGPLLGGLILAASSWRWIFAINVLPIAVTLWLTKRLEPMGKRDPSVPIDSLGSLLGALGLGGTVFALIEQPRYGWGSPSIYLPLIAGITMLAMFVKWESKNASPMLPLSLFEARNFSVGNLATLAIYGGLSVATFLITITLQQIGGYSALQAALAMMPVTVVMFVLSSRFGALAGKYGPRFFMAAGPIVAGLGFLLMTRLQPHVHYAVDLLPGVLVFALGLATTVAPLTSAILGCIEPKRSGIASAVNNAVARIAGLLTIALVGIITGPHLDIDGFRRVMEFTATLLIGGGLISAFGIQNNPQSRRKLQIK